MKTAKRGGRSPVAMAAPPRAHPIRALYVKLFLTALAGAAAYVFFVVFNHRYLNHLSPNEVLLLEAGVIVLLAYAIARSLTTAVSAVMAQRGALGRAHVVRLFLNIIVAVIAVVGLTNLAGVSAESILLGSAFAGIVLGLAAQTVLGNVFAGLLLVFADPFRPGDRVGFVYSAYPALPPSYPHELEYPVYSGTIEDIGLVYTVLKLDSGGIARVPNAAVISSLVLQPHPTSISYHRVRMTFPQSTAITTVEGALPAIAAAFPRASAFDPGPRFEVTDISAATWDGTFLVSSPGRTDADVRNTVLRLVLARLPGASASTKP